MDHRVSFLKSHDDIRLAYAVSGKGAPLVRTGTWLTHLEHDWTGPVWRHWLQQLSAHNRLICYDERGCGLSQRVVGPITFEHWVADLEAVVDHLDLETFDLLGASQGGLVSIVYAARHPERVKRLVLINTTPISWKKLRARPSTSSGRRCPG